METTKLVAAIAVSMGLALGAAAQAKEHEEQTVSQADVPMAVQKSAEIEAKGGQILLSQRMHAAVERDVDVESVGELSLKGISRPVPAVNVTALKAVPA